MGNPFMRLGEPRLENPKGEEVTGAFSCQEDDCYEVASTARYLEEVSMLTWKCKDGHMSRLEDFNLG